MLRPSLTIVGISKGGFGGGLGRVGVPLIALSIPLAQAAGILLPILCVMDLFALRSFWGQFSRPNLRVLLLASMLGIAAATVAFGALDEAWIRGIVGLIAGVFTLRYVIGLVSRGGEEDAPRDPGRASGWLWGTIAGFTSTVAHAGGPPLAVHLLPQRLDRTLYVGTIVVLFTGINYVKLVPYAWLGQLQLTNLETSLALAPLAPLGIWLGRWLHDRVDDTIFYRNAYAMLLVVGVKLLFDFAQHF